MRRRLQRGFRRSWDEHRSPFGDRPRILSETLEFKGEFLGLAPNPPTPLRNKILDCRVSSAVCAARGQEVRRSEGQEIRVQSTRVKIKSRQELKGILEQLKAEGKEIVFTNGCFDLLHPGHVHYLEKAKAQGDVLVVALNTDSSVRKIKGPARPVLDEVDRCEMISALGCVDFVTIFEEETPQTIIEELIPQVLVKGGDWPIDQIVGRQIVEGNGGRVISVDFEREFSTSDIIDRIRRSGS